MKHFFNAKYDVVFKSSVIGNINVLKKILESALDITIDEIIVKNNEETKDYIKEKNKIRDCYCICGKRKINIEVNSKNYNGLRKRNFAYLAYQYSSSLREGQDYKDMKEEYIQLNLTWGIKSKRVCNQYEMASIYDKEDKWIDNLKIIEYNMDRLKELRTSPLLLLRCQIIR